MIIDKQKLDQLLSENKIEEIGEYLKSIIQSPLSQEERGEAILFLTTTYMNAMNSINQDYKDMLKDTLATLEEVNKAESASMDEIALQKVRSELNK
jgi:hypothetical protein